MPRRLTRDDLEELLRTLGIEEPEPDFASPARPATTEARVDTTPVEQWIPTPPRGVQRILEPARKVGTFVTGISRLAPEEKYELEQWAKKNPRSKALETLRLILETPSVSDPAPLRVGGAMDYARYGAPVAKKNIEGMANALWAARDPLQYTALTGKTPLHGLKEISPDVSGMEPGQVRAGNTMVGVGLLAAPQFRGPKGVLSAKQIIQRVASKKELLARLEELAAQGGGKIGTAKFALGKKYSLAEIEGLILQTKQEIGEALRGSAVLRSIKTGKRMIPKTREEFFSGMNLHGSRFDPRTRGTKIADEGGFFTTDSPEAADWYANSSIRNARKGRGAVYGAQKPQNPLDLRDLRSWDSVVSAIVDDLRHLDPVDNPLYGRVARAVDRLVSEYGSASPSANKLSSLAYDIALEKGKLEGKGISSSYFNDIVRKLGHDAWITTESIPGKTARHNVTVYLDRPQLKSYEDYLEFGFPERGEVVGETFAKATTRKEIPQPVFKRAGLVPLQKKQDRLATLRNLMEMGGGTIGKRTVTVEDLQKMIPKAEASLRRTLEKSWGGKEKKAFQVMAESAVSPETPAYKVQATIPFARNLFSTTRPTNRAGIMGKVLNPVNAKLNEITYRMLEYGNPASVGRPLLTRTVQDYFGQRSVARHKAYDWDVAAEKLFKKYDDPLAASKTAFYASDDPALLTKLKASADPKDRAIAEFSEFTHNKNDEVWSDAVAEGLLHADAFVESYVPHVVKFKDDAQRAAFIKEFTPKVQGLFARGTEIRGLGGRPGALKARKHTLTELQTMLQDMAQSDPVKWGGLTVDDDFVRVESRYLEAVNTAIAKKRMRDQLLLFSREDGHPILHPGAEPPAAGYVPLAPKQEISVPGTPLKAPDWGRTSLDWARRWFSVQGPDGTVIMPAKVWVDRDAYQSLRQFFESVEPNEFTLLKKMLYLSKRVKLYHPMVHGWHQINNEMAGPEGENLIEAIHGITRGQQALAKTEEVLPGTLARKFGLKPKMIRTPGPTGQMVERLRPPTWGDLIYDAEAHRLNLGEWDELWRNVFDIKKDWWASENENSLKRAGRSLVDFHDKILWDSLVKPIAVDLYMKYFELYRRAGFPMERAKYMAGMTGTQLSGFMPKETMGALNRNLGRFWYFARDWTQTNRRQLRGTILGTYGATPIFNLAERKALQKQDALVLARSLYYLYGVGNVLNYGITKKLTGEGRFLWQNPEGNRLDTVFWISPDGTEYSKNLVDQVRDMVRWVPGAHKLPGMEGEPPFWKTESYKVSPLVRNIATVGGQMRGRTKSFAGISSEMAEAWMPWGVERTFVDPFPVSALNLVFGSIKRSHPYRRGAPRELPRTSIAGVGQSVVDRFLGDKSGAMTEEEKMKYWMERASQ